MTDKRLSQSTVPNIDPEFAMIESAAGDEQRRRYIEQGQQYIRELRAWRDVVSRHAGRPVPLPRPPRLK